MKKIALTISLLSIFIAAFGKEGIYLEFKIITSGSSIQMNGINKSYYSGGNSRTEIILGSSSMPNPYNIITVVRQDAPGKAYTISEKDKTYSETEISNTPGNENKEDYEITLIGKELVNGYSCTHATALNKKTKRTSEVWLSKDVKGYAEYTSLRNTYLGGSKFFEALKEKGAEGFVVRSVMVDGKGENMQMDLVKAEKKDIDETMFSLDGYTRKAVAGMPGGMLPQTAEQIQKMTPGERQKYMEDMKAKYGQPH